MLGCGTLDTGHARYVVSGCVVVVVVVVSSVSGCGGDVVSERQPG
jgi:hypothetical protein